jgi:uncharacterized membrane protein YcaP (DUF421 family)
MSPHFFTPDYLHYLSVMAGRAFFMFAYLVVLFRLLGKRQIGQLNIFDLAAIMGVANAVQNGMTMGSGNLSVGIQAVLVLLLTGRVLSTLLVKQPGIENRMIGSPTLLISDGKLLEDNMHRELVTESQVLAALREHGLTKREDVRMAVLEVDGSISIIPRG